MASTILSNGVRNNLLTLQQTTAQQGVIQNRLATGRKVNSAIDNPVNYFTAASLSDRSSQLTGLLDGISNGIQRRSVMSSRRRTGSRRGSGSARRSNWTRTGSRSSERRHDPHSR
ncbi:hypothetical protein [Bosea beijingensis]|uniref:hypothetical protein n=1 Tax=Bosea beijingensis TaxID=3068632 RepID=UPI003BEEEB70